MLSLALWNKDFTAIDRRGERETERQTDRDRQRGGRERETETERNRNRQREREGGRQRQSETQRERQREGERHRERQREREGKHSVILPAHFLQLLAFLQPLVMQVLTPFNGNLRRLVIVFSLFGHHWAFICSLKRALIDHRHDTES